MFKRVQEAYEILSNKEKRDIYDVYGTEGLSSGMELSDPLKSREELRKEWEAFREKQKQQNVDAQVNHRGVYVFRVDASALAAPYSHDVPRTPEISNVYMTTGVDVPIEASKDWGPFASERDVIHLGGLVSVRKEVGGGSFLAGYKRVYQDYSTLELHAAAGLKSMVSIQSTVQLSQQSSASLISTWQPKSGLGLQFVTSRQLSEKYSGEVSWVLGPADSAGVSLGINRRTEKTALSARVDVGVATGIALRAVRQLNDVLNARAAVKFGTHGIELDIGGNKRMSELSTAGLSVVVGIQGVLLRFRYNRAGHLFEFPFFLSSTFDPRILAGAYILPPLCIYLATNCVIAPVQKAIESKRYVFCFFSSDYHQKKTLLILINFSYRFFLKNQQQGKESTSCTSNSNPPSLERSQSSRDINARCCKKTPSERNVRARFSCRLGAVWGRKCGQGRERT